MSVDARRISAWWVVALFLPGLLLEKIDAVPIIFPMILVYSALGLMVYLDLRDRRLGFRGEDAIRGLSATQAARLGGVLGALVGIAIFITAATVGLMNEGIALLIAATGAGVLSGGVTAWVGKSRIRRGAGIIGLLVWIVSVLPIYVIALAVISVA